MSSYFKTSFTLMAFPQHVDSTDLLTLHIIFVPRNISPLEKIQSQYLLPATMLTAFADSQPRFAVKVVNNPDEFPGKVPANERVATLNPLGYAPNIRKLYQTLKDATNADGTAKYFDIDETRSIRNSGLPNPHQAPAAVDASAAVKKYLPLTYRNAFNFTAPRTPNAVIDDSYLCAIRGEKILPKFVPDLKVSWGKVYAHLLRQPLLAENAGLLYKATVQLADDDFAKGGWLYLDIEDGTTYDDEQKASLTDTAEGPFIARYAARIPLLKKNEARSLFATVLFPVMDEGVSPTGIYDELYIEAARFNDGFATIVHANQPLSHNLLKEEQDGFHPQKEIGIRLGWEDEQILIWYLRQLAIDESVGTDRLDAPLGVNGYHIDVRENEISAGAANDWESLNAVTSNKKSIWLEDIEIGQYPPDGSDSGELPFQVYPTKLNSAGGVNYWLPMYFGNWNNASMVLPDRVASELYANDQDLKPVKISDTYSPIETKTRLVYGHIYDFRVRMSDISGGGPNAGSEPLNPLSSHIATVPFKRYVAPNTLRILDKDDLTINLETLTLARYQKMKSPIIHNTDGVNFDGDTLCIKRPLLGFPAVVYTGKQIDPIDQLRKVSKQFTKETIPMAFGIADPDVVKVELKVEVETLQLDNLASDDGKEHYITLYKTYRNFPSAYEDAVIIPIEYVDENVLKLTEKDKPFTKKEHNDTIGVTSGAITLPTARNIRLTLRAVCVGDNSYWGHSNSDPDLDGRYGKTTVLNIRSAAFNEEDIFFVTRPSTVLQGIYLQPDPVGVRLNPITFKALQGTNEGMPDIVQRLAKQLDVACKETTLVASNGERLQFWCSNLVRHSMAPDNSSLTFANKKELAGHWFVCTDITINRDWSWDGLETNSISVQRRRRRGSDSTLITDLAYETIGELELRRIASFQAIQPGEKGIINRQYTRIIFIDLIDMQPTEGLKPDTEEVEYLLLPHLKSDWMGNKFSDDNTFESEKLLLPTTINPTQVPKLIGAGVALSPYVRNVPYSVTEPRKRFLWLEFDKEPVDGHDDLFCRVLAYAPDQLLSNNNPELMDLQEETPLPIDPEYVRIVTPESAHEHSGLNAMQKLEKSIDKERHFYLLPTPPGLHTESTELFGLFTYEFRYGHSDRIWSTAQGRFGRQLRVTGLQHPAPNMYCMVTRNEKKICVSAPYAQTVFNGKNVTSDPPRTSIWCLLYAQVKQADGLDYRNILLDEIELAPLLRSRFEAEFKTRIRLAKREKNEILVRDLLLEFNQLNAREKESVLHGHSCWCNKDVNDMLELYGLPLDSPLSVLCTEVYGQITNINEHVNDFSSGKKRSLLQEVSSVYGSTYASQMNRGMRGVKYVTPSRESADPLNSDLGLYRILRTSPLTEVPFVCCTDCG